MALAHRAALPARRCGRGVVPRCVLRGSSLHLSMRGSRVARPLDRAAATCPPRRRARSRRGGSATSTRCRCRSRPGAPCRRRRCGCESRRCRARRGSRAPPASGGRRARSCTRGCRARRRGPRPGRCSAGSATATPPACRASRRGRGEVGRVALEEHPVADIDGEILGRAGRAAAAAAAPKSVPAVWSAFEQAAIVSAAATASASLRGRGEIEVSMAGRLLHTKRLPAFRLMPSLGGLSEGSVNLDGGFIGPARKPRRTDTHREG